MMRYTNVIFLAAMIVIAISALASYNIRGNKEMNVRGAASQLRYVKGLTLPHHEVAKELVIGALDTLSENNDYKNILLISPNHYYPASYTFTTDSKTHLLLSQTGQGLDDTFPHLIIDDRVIEQEHGLQNVQKYLKQYYPDATYHLLATSLKYDPSELDLMARLLSEIGNDTLYVLSVDFAHGHTSNQAILNNIETVKAISSFNYRSVLQFDDNNMDAPVGAALWLKIMENLDSKRWQTIYNSHTGILDMDPSIQGTGYVIGVFSKQ